MSIQIHACRFLLALTDQKEFDSLVADLKFNMAWGAWTELPCPHVPKHPDLTQAQADEINKRLGAEINVPKPS